MKKFNEIKKIISEKLLILTKKILSDENYENKEKRLKKNKTIVIIRLIW